MKKITFILLSIVPFLNFGQDNTNHPTFNFSITADCVFVTQPLRDAVNVKDLFPGEEKEHVYKNNFRRQKYTNENALPQGNDPLWQKRHGEQYNKAPIQNFNGVSTSLGFPPDPSGAAGPNHYVQMVNSRIQIFDKDGNTLHGPVPLNSILSSNNGDPIVVYDRYADRWFLSGFGVGNSLSFAVSNTPDPLGTYTTYVFNLSTFPDYPKYGVWHDGYYVTSNTSGADCYILERDKMLVGDPTAQFISLTIPNLGTGAGTATGGFHSVLPADADFTLPPSSEKLNLFYFQDDAWTGITQDEIKIWEVTVDYITPGNSSCIEIQTLPVTPFDSQFNASWNDIQQPGTTQRLDGIPGAFMYRAQFTQWGGHNTILLNHTVDVDGTDHAGVRWYELRQSGGVWSVYQEGTYAPDAESRFMGSISMDYQGNIALGFAISGPTVSPSIRYTGRYSTDPLGQFTLAEEVIVNGSGFQTGGNRYGDYAHLMVDPTDNATFWYTCEYINGGTRSTRIASFKIANDFNNDIGVISLNTPISGALTGFETIEIDIKNFGLVPQSSFPVAYQINGGAIVSETYSGPTINPGEVETYTFTTTADMSAEGIYDFKLYTALVGDEFLMNDTLLTSVTHLFQNDIGISVINSPNSSEGLFTETITVSIENFGTLPQSNFNVGYMVDGGAPVIENVTATVNPGTTILYDFTAEYDFSLLGTYEIKAFTALGTDDDLLNDTLVKNVEKLNCAPVSNCSFGDGVRRFKYTDIDNSSGCTAGGYVNYTSMNANVLVGYENTMRVESAWFTQFTSVWIDFNDNNYFESEEKIVDGVQTNLGANIPVTIDNTKPLGQHLLRVRNSDTQADVEDPCNDIQYGETEDYVVTLSSDMGTIELPKSQLKIISNVNNIYVIEFNGFEGNNQTVLTIHNSIGQLVYTVDVNINENNQITIDLNKYAKGAYLINLKDNQTNAVLKIIKN